MSNAADFGLPCKLDEVNLRDEEHNDVIEDIYPSAELNRQWEAWQTRIMAEFENTAISKRNDWEAQIKRVVPDRADLYRSDVADALNAGVTSFRREAPARLLTQTSDAVARYGAKPALGLLRYLDDQLAQANEQLLEEARRDRASIERWHQEFGEAFSGAGNRLKARRSTRPGDHLSRHPCPSTRGVRGG